MKQKKEPTLLAELIATADVHTELDNSCKKLLSHRLILAWILKYAVEEFSDHSVEAIARRYILDDTIQVSHTDISHDKQVTGTNTECKPLDEGKNTFDLLFLVRLPGSKKSINILINIEAQGNFYPGHPLLKRGVFYACRLIADQYGTIFTHTRYGKLQKVYSIWICTNPPKYRCGSITKYGFTEQNILGKVRELRKHYDLLSVLVICLNKSQTQAGTDTPTISATNGNRHGTLNRGKEPSELIDMLTTLLSPELSFEEKQNILESRFQLPITTEIKEDMNDMCNISRSIKIEALQEGFYKGISHGKSDALLESLRNLMKNLQFTAIQAMDALSIPQEERAQYMSKL